MCYDHRIPRDGLARGARGARSVLTIAHVPRESRVVIAGLVYHTSGHILTLCVSEANGKGRGIRKTALEAESPARRNSTRAGLTLWTAIRYGRGYISLERCRLLIAYAL